MQTPVRRAFGRGRMPLSAAPACATRPARRQVALHLVLILAALPLSGCAGGWKHGAPPGGDGAAQAPAATGAPAATSTQATDGTRFAWTGGGNSVTLAGDFNNWSQDAEPMAKQADGSFLLLKQLPPGRHAYKFVVDGQWKEDPKAKETVDDGFGGKNAIVVVAAGNASGAAAGAAGSGGATGAAGAGRATDATGAGGATGAAGAVGATAGGAARAPQATADGVRFTFAGAAQSVHLAGDFNAWSTTADPMTRQPDGAWALVKKLAPGRYTYKFVVNGSTWKHDEANPESADDGFGGKNSILVVP